MLFIVLFDISGVAMIVLLITKWIEGKRRKQFFISRMISKGDVYIRNVYHKTAHSYSEGKDKIDWFVKKKVPMQSRSLMNRSVSYLKDKREQYLNELRDSRLLNRSEGISEYFKHMSSVEKGNGEINDVYETGSQEEEKELE